MAWLPKGGSTVVISVKTYRSRCQDDIFSGIELFLQTSCHQELLITRMTFTGFSSSLSNQESTEITINTYRC